MGCTSVRDVGCFVCTALLSFYMWIQSASFPILSRGNVNKHVYCGGTFVACSSPQHQPKQCGEGGDKNGEAHASVPSQRTAAHGVPPVLLRKNYWRIPIKTGSSQGSETATTLRGGPLTLQRATRNPLAKRQKTDCCVTGWNKNTALPVSLGRRGAAVAGLHWRCLVFSGVRTQFLSI